MGLDVLEVGAHGACGGFDLGTPGSRERWHLIPESAEPRVNVAARTRGYGVKRGCGGCVTAFQRRPSSSCVLLGVIVAVCCFGGGVSWLVLY